MLDHSVTKLHIYLLRMSSLSVYSGVPSVACIASRNRASVLYSNCSLYTCLSTVHGALSYFNHFMLLLGCYFVVTMLLLGCYNVWLLRTWWLM